MNKEKKIIKWFILPVLLAVYCFWDVNKGVDLSDTGYNLERFYNFMESAGSGLSTFWSNYIGYLFTKLPGAEKWTELVPLTVGTANANNYGGYGSANSFNTDTWVSTDNKTVETLVEENTK